MTTRILYWNTCQRLDCDLPAAAKLCLPGVLVDAETEDEFKFIDATVKELTTPCSGCGNIFQYIIQYDDSQLASYDEETLTADPPLYPSDIHGVFCDPCLLALIAAQLPPEETNWHLLGNTGTVDGSNFIGTADNTAFDIRVNNKRARRTVPTATTHNLIDGYENNSVSGSVGSVVLGGGSLVSGVNSISGISDFSSVVGGDNQNITTSTHASILGGNSNRIVTSNFANIFGGFDNHITNSERATIGSGNGHVITDSNFTAVVSGSGTIIITSPYAGVLSGADHEITDSGYASVFSGDSNHLIAASKSTVNGGAGHLINYNEFSTILAGDENTVDNKLVGEVSSTEVFYQNLIGAGNTNIVSASVKSSILNGQANEIRQHGYDADNGNTEEFDENGVAPHNTIISGDQIVIEDQQYSYVITGGSCTIETDPADLDPKIRIHNGICNGFENHILSSSFSQIINGHINEISLTKTSSFTFSSASFAGYATILNGVNNTIINGSFSTILGGAGLLVGEATIGYQNPKVVNTRGAYMSPQTDLSAFTELFFLGDMDLWIGNTDNTARKLKLFEPNTDVDYSSANYSSFQAQSQAADIKYVLPATAGSVGQVLKIQAVAGTTVTLEWANDNT